jgi:hypothetical protein
MMSFIQKISQIIVNFHYIKLIFILYIKYQFTKMGVYDFFKGTCPYCSGQIDVDPTYGKCGDIQTKIWTHQPNIDDCFREFYPGTITPIPIEYMELCIGPTCCCDKYINVIVINNVIQNYQIMYDEPIT